MLLTKISQYNNRMDIHIAVYFDKNPMKTFLYAFLEIAENPRNRPYDLYVYIPICFQFDKILCELLPN